MPGSEFESLEKILETHIPDEELKEVKRILFGKETKKFDLPACEVEAALERDFELHGYLNVLIQNRIVLPTDAPVLVQIREIGEMVDVAAMCGVNIVSFQECVPPFYGSEFLEMILLCSPSQVLPLPSVPGRKKCGQSLHKVDTPPASAKRLEVKGHPRHKNIPHPMQYC
uniref:Uncharacterized protein n=1 Tax=Oncorhynchus tshawytscha TaxID=74940 RepID=A0A8C8CWK8_ONCTS